MRLLRVKSKFKGDYPMNLQNDLNSRSYSCPVKDARDLRLDLRVRCGLEAESVSYAVRRFIRRSPTLMRTYAGESYRLRLEHRRRSGFGFAAPAALLELPGSWAGVRISVTPAGIEVTRIGLFGSLPAAQHAAGIW